MPLFQNNILSNQVIKAKSDKLMKRALRDARKKIRKGFLSDGHDLSLYLRTIDERYSHLKADINNATRIYDYAKIRSDKMAETRQLLDFFSQDYAELDRLSRILAKKAEQAERLEDFKHQKLSNIDPTKLYDNLESLIEGDK